MFSIPLRRCTASSSQTLRSAGPSRSVSSSTKKRGSKGSKNLGQLPPEKLRALISLYHQSDTFITQDNLLERINAALISSKSGMAPTPSAPGMTSFIDALAMRRDSPKRTQGVEGEALPLPGTVVEGGRNVWSQWKTKREQRVLEALYGLDATHPGQLMPSLEAVLENAEKLEKEKKEA